MKIVNIEGPCVDEHTLQPYLKITLNMPLEVTQAHRTEQENAWIIYQAWQKAFEEWNNHTTNHTP